MTPIQTLFRLTEELAHLLAQENMNRVMFHKNPHDHELHVQLRLQQHAIDARRHEIFQTMLIISSTN